MKSWGIMERLDDAINPVVVKELRQAVKSRLIVAVLLLFLLVQLAFMGIFLMIAGLEGRLDSAEFQAGRDVFSVLQGILLATCMLFIPAYTAFRLGAERSDINTDLLFISTLKPRAIIWGKFVAAMVLAVMIFSACMPFMAFTYFLRGIDLPSIFFVIGLDFLVVLAAVMLAIFVAVLPANRIFKALLGIFCLWAMLMMFMGTLAGTLDILNQGLASFFERRDTWAILSCVLVGALGGLSLFYAWSVALVSPHSSNRALPMRLLVAIYCLVSGVVLGWVSRQSGREEPMVAWIVGISLLLCLCLVIAVNEREQWGPRVTRTIPKRWWLRAPLFLFYSGAGGGVLLAVLLMALTALGFLFWKTEVWHALAPVRGFPGMPGRRVDYVVTIFETMLLLFLYVYCYAMTAVLFRQTLLARGQAQFTWVVMIFLIAIGSALPYLMVFLFHQKDFRFQYHYYWLVTNPAAGLAGVGDYRFQIGNVFFVFTGIWAALITIVNVPWFVRQMRRFRPFTGDKPIVLRELSTPSVTAAPLDVTRTAT
jgi:hypothetical protein